MISPHAISRIDAGLSSKAECVSMLLTCAVQIADMQRRLEAGGELSADDIVTVAAAAITCCEIGRCRT